MKINIDNCIKQIYKLTEELDKTNDPVKMITLSHDIELLYDLCIKYKIQKTRIKMTKDDFIKLMEK
jgi:hypothetical protein